jgi:biotin synthase-like enzyme
MVEDDTIICVLWACSCGHPEADHDGPDTVCQAIMEVETKDGIEVCSCLGFTVAPDSTQDAEGAPEATSERFEADP